MNKSLQISIVVVFVLGLCLLLKFYFESTYLLIVVVLSLGLFSGIISRYFVGYIVPGQTLFRYRFVIYGAGFGLMIGLLLFLTKSIKNQTFLVQDLEIWLLIAVPIGIIGKGTSSYRKFRKLTKRTINENGRHDLICDFAIFADSEYKTARGLLVLSVNKLAFYSMTSNDCIYEGLMSDLNPEIKKSRLMGIPNGFSFQNKMYNVNVAFPLYWLELIETETKKHTHKTVQIS